MKRRFHLPLAVRGPRLAVFCFLWSLPAAPPATSVIEGWSAWDAFYMTVTTVATVGFREVHPLSRAGQAFTSC